MTTPRTQAARDLLTVVRAAVLDPSIATMLSGEGRPQLLALVSVELLEQDILAIEAEALPTVEALARALHRMGYCATWTGDDAEHDEGHRNDASAILAALRDDP